jgi:hypothetical protein
VWVVRVVVKVTGGAGEHRLKAANADSQLEDLKSEPAESPRRQFFGQFQGKMREKFPTIVRHRSRERWQNDVTTHAAEVAKRAGRDAVECWRFSVPARGTCFGRPTARTAAGCR